ncbi:MAG: alpha/beta hydrolase [Anaerolineae bacterium]|nr:alpha/beta hydrolase [Anaerolineae bacterium]
MIPYDHEFIVTNGVRLHVVMAGPVDGEPVILLHGFPEFWYGWRKQIDYLAEHGYRVIVPDQRGYNISDKPKAMAAYNLDALSGDVVGLIDYLKRDKVFLVGHDWGGGVAWFTANKYPERIKKLAILNVPHHSVFRKYLSENREQQRRSWYMFFFQLPMLPDFLSGLNHAEGLVRALRTSSRPGTFSEDDFVEYRKAWTQPGAITAMINWYRATAQTPPQKLASKRITMPTLVLWGKKDTALNWELAEKSLELCDDGRVVYFEDASHWVQHEEAEQVNAHLAAFLRD